MHFDQDETMHTHTHTHADGTTHTHEHHHHDNADDHDHHSHDCAEHSHCAGECASCREHSPREELIALMKYMVAHNASHANELAKLAEQLRELGEATACEQILLAVSDFEKGNLRLSAVLSAMNA